MRRLALALLSIPLSAAAAERAPYDMAATPEATTVRQHALNQCRAMATGTMRAQIDCSLAAHRAYAVKTKLRDMGLFRTYAEALRHGLGRAKRVLVMGDGAVWIWTIANDRFKEAAQRIDLYHIKQHLWTCARALYEDPKEQALWVRKMKNRLKKEQSAKVIHELEEALVGLAPAQQETARKEVNYFKEHQGRMTYAQAEHLNEPSGTGAMESTCRQYQCRFKRPGQFWSQQGDEGLLCLDTFWRNGRWDLLFPQSKKFDPSKN